MESTTNRVLVAAIIAILIAGSAACLWTAGREEQNMREQLLIQARLAGLGINPAQVASLTGSDADLGSLEYAALKGQMEGLRAADPDLRFAYLIGRRQDGDYFFYVDSEHPDSEDYSPPGQPYPEVTVLIRKVYSNGVPLTEGPDTDRWGTWVSGVVPVTDPSTGEVRAVFGMDVDARSWYWQILVACLPFITGTLLILVLVISFASIQKRNDRERQRLEESERAIRESEERYRLLFTRSPVGIAQLDLKGKVVTANEKFAEILGIPADQVSRLAASDAINNPGLIAAINDSLQGKTGFFEGDYFSQRGEGHQYIRMVSQPLRTGGGDIAGAIGIFEDISERRASEDRERYQAALFLKTQQALVQIAKIPWETIGDFYHRLTVIDSGTIDVARVSVWLFSADLSELVCAECYDRSDESHSRGMRLKRSDYPRYFMALDQNRIIAADDARIDERTAEFSAGYLVPLGITSMLDVPIRREGQMTGIVCHEHTGVPRRWNPLEQDFAASVADLVSTALERADRKTAEQALGESERRYRSVVEDQTELIARFRPGGTHVFVNDAYCRFFSVERNQILGKKLLPHVFPKDQPLIRDHLASLTRASPVAEITHRVILPSGEVRWLRWIDRAIYDEKGDLVEYQSVGRDVSWQKQIEESLSRTNQKLNLLSKITRHDVLNQLIVLNGFLQLSSEAVDNPEDFHVFMENAQRAVATIEAQINFTRIYQDMGTIAPSWQDVSACIIRAKGALPLVDIRTELHRPDLHVLADPLLEKVFYNLFDNSIRYGGEMMKTIRISSEETPDGLLIICKDDGVGIAESDKKRLFTQGYGKNTGFGLFLSREILAISGITIRETGTPGHGARFEIAVPQGAWSVGKPHE